MFQQMSFKYEIVQKARQGPSIGFPKLEIEIVDITGTSQDFVIL